MLLGLGGFLSATAYHTYGERQKALRARPARFSVDLSKAGSYSGRLRQVYDGTAALQLVIDVTPPLRSGEQLHAQLTGFRGRLLVRDALGRIVLDRDVDRFTALVWQGPDGGRAAPELSFPALAPGDYDLSLVVIEPASQIARGEQELLVHYDYFTRAGFVVPISLAVIALSIGATLALSLRRTGRCPKGLATEPLKESRLWCRSVLIVFGLLDGLVLVFYGRDELAEVCFAASRGYPIPRWWMLIEVFRACTALSLAVTCIGLIGRRRWAVILSYAQLPLRILFLQVTFRFLHPLYPVLAHRGQSGVWLLYWIMAALEVGRLIATVFVHRRLWPRRGPEREASRTVSPAGGPWLKWVSIGWAVLALGGAAFIGTGAAYRSIHSATQARDQSAVRIRLALWPDSVDAKNAEGDTPLHVAADLEAHFPSMTQVTTLLLEEGADPNAKNRNGDSPLHLAVTSRPLVTILLEHGADARARNDFGETPLHRAAGANKPMVIRLLLAHEADPNALDNAGETPLHDTNLWDRKAAVRILLEAGADPNIADMEGRTILHIVIDDGRHNPEPHDLAAKGETIALLTSHGANVNARDKTGQTPLHLVVFRWSDPEKHRLATAKMLLDAKADPGAKNDDGQTPLGMAEEQDAEALVKLLRKYRSH